MVLRMVEAKLDSWEKLLMVVTWLLDDA